LATAPVTTNSASADDQTAQKVPQHSVSGAGNFKTEGNDANDNRVVFFDKNSGAFVKAFAIPWWKLCPPADGGLSPENLLEQDGVGGTEKGSVFSPKVDNTVDALHAAIAEDVNHPVELLDAEAIVRATRAAVVKHSAVSVAGFSHGTQAATAPASADSRLSLAQPLPGGCGREFTSKNLSIATAAVSSPMALSWAGLGRGEVGQNNHRLAVTPRQSPYSSTTVDTHQTPSTDNALDRNASLPTAQFGSALVNGVIAAPRVLGGNNTAPAYVVTSLQLPPRPQTIAPKSIVYTSSSAMPRIVSMGGVGVAVSSGVGGGGGVVVAKQRVPVLSASSVVGGGGMHSLPSARPGVSGGGNNSQLVYSNAFVHHPTQNGSVNIKYPQLPPVRLATSTLSNFTPVTFMSKVTSAQNRIVPVSSSTETLVNRAWMEKIEAGCLAPPTMQLGGVRAREEGLGQDEGPQTKHARVVVENALNQRVVSLFTPPNQSNEMMQRGGQNNNALFGFNPESSKVILANMEVRIKF